MKKRLANVDKNNLSNEGTHFILLKKYNTQKSMQSW